MEKNTTVGTIPKSNIEIVERGKIYTTNAQIHDSSLPWLGTDTSIKSGGVKLVLWYSLFFYQSYLVYQLNKRSEMTFSCL
jgi:hypothetical protein